MHCTDCHFEQDVHGDGHLYGSVRDAVEIACEDCHGTISERARLVTGPERERLGGPVDGSPLPRDVGGDRVQRSRVTPGLEWTIPQVKDTSVSVKAHTTEHATS
jgi:hypothetical protein